MEPRISRRPGDRWRPPTTAVYLQQDGELIAVATSGAVQWRVGVTDEITAAAIAGDGTVIAAAKGASVIAVA